MRPERPAAARNTPPPCSRNAPTTSAALAWIRVRRFGQAHPTLIRTSQFPRNEMIRFRDRSDPRRRSHVRPHHRLGRSRWTARTEPPPAPGPRRVVPAARAACWAVSDSVQCSSCSRPDACSPCRRRARSPGSNSSARPRRAVGSTTTTGTPRTRVRSAATRPSSSEPRSDRRRPPRRRSTRTCTAAGSDTSTPPGSRSRAAARRPRRRRRHSCSD